MKIRTILQTIETSEPGGAETVLLHLASRLSHDRFRFLALLPGEGWLSERLQDAGIPVFFADSNNWHDFRLLREMSRLVNREHVDLIHSHLPGQNFYSCVVGARTGRKTVATYHAAHDLRFPLGWKANTRLAVVRTLADAVVAVSDDVATLLQRAHFHAGRTTRIYNGIDVERLSVMNDGRLRRSLRLPETSKLVGTVACLRPEKGYDLLIQAARMVVERIPGVHFVTAGEMDPVAGQPLFDMVDRLGLKDRFHFLGFRGDIPEILSELDVFVLPSISEGLPLALLEAMAAGKPTVATDCGGPSEVVINAVTGLLIPPGKPQAIATAVTDLLTDRQLACRLARAGRAKVRSDFGLQRMLEEHEALYERLLAEV